MEIPIEGTKFVTPAKEVVAKMNIKSCHAGLDPASSHNINRLRILDPGFRRGDVCVPWKGVQEIFFIPRK